MKQQPITSKLANIQATSEMRQIHYAKILEGLELVKNANYEEIALVSGMEKNQVSRRLKEMEGRNLVLKTERTAPTSSGRKAYIYEPIAKETVE